MQTWENIWTFRTKNFCVSYDVTEDYDLDLSWDDDGSVREGLESGRFQAFQVRMAVYYKGDEVGVDYLGGCIYENAKAFIDHRGIRHINGGRCGSYFTDMVRTAIKEARDKLSEPRPYLRGPYSAPWSDVEADRIRATLEK